MQSLITSNPFPGGERVHDLHYASISFCAVLCLAGALAGWFSIVQRATKQTSRLPFALRGARKLHFSSVFLSSGLMGYKTGRLTKTPGNNLPTSLLIKTTLTQVCIFKAASYSIQMDLRVNVNI